MSLLVSASQLKTFGPLIDGPRGQDDGCPRKWWFEKVARLPQQGTASDGIVFGNVLHAVLERWLEADATGRNPKGNPVELYPEGWDWDFENNQGISDEDRELIPQLVEEAVKRGYLQRVPGQLVEDAFVLPLVPEEEIYVTGRIDLLRYVPPTVQDHKGTGSMRYALSKAKLADDDQMLLYAHVLGGRLNLADDDEIALAHNVFKRHDPRKGVGELTLRQTEAKVTFGEAKTRWEEFKARAKVMHQVSKVRDWFDIEVQIGDQCNAFGGCRFSGICQRRETPLKFKRRVLRLAQPQKKKEENVTEMTLEEALAKKRGKKLKGDALIDAVEEKMKKPPVPATGINAPETNAAEIAPVKATVKKGKAKKKQKPDQGQVAVAGQYMPFTICKGCIPAKVAEFTQVVNWSDMVHNVIVDPDLGNCPDLGVYYSKPAYERGSQLAKLAPQIASACKGSTVVITGELTSEENTLLSALMPLADRIFVRAG